MQQAASAEQPRRAVEREKPRGAAVGRIGMLIVAVGGTVAAMLAVSVVWAGGSAAGSGTSALSPLPASEIEAASTSLYSDLAVSMVEDARTCKAPLAEIWLQKWGSDAPGDTIRVRSGGYLSPPFKVLGETRRVAIPYPAPYQSGSGAIEVLGEGRSYTVALVPARSIPVLAGIRRIDVKWQPKSPC